MRKDREDDKRLYGGIVRRLDDHAGVLYNADGEMTEALVTPYNCTVCILARNRSSYLRDLLESVEVELPSTVGRHILVNNSEDHTVDMLSERFSNWSVERIQRDELPAESNALKWLRACRPDALSPAMKDNVSGYGPSDSIAWLRNRMIRECQSRFMISLDDDMLVRPGWFAYLIKFQNSFYAYGVINNFAAFLLDTHVVTRIGWFDERYLRSYGYEDNDFLARMNEAQLRWILGYNRDHDWRSNEEENPRGRGTGFNLFVHRCAKMDGGFSASHIEHEESERNDAHFGNWCWYAAKWNQIPADSESQGVLDQPPFRDYVLQRLEPKEPDWYPRDFRKEKIRYSRVEVTQDVKVPRMSILLSNRNTLRYLQLAIKSCRESLIRPDHEIIVYDDASTDGSVEWIQNNAARFDVRILRNPGPERKGIVYAYDELVHAATESICLIAHSDMYFAKNADAELWRHFQPDTVATCTRVEPPIHRDEPVRLQQDFGLDADSFDEEGFLRWAEQQKDRHRTTEGIFAPILCWRQDYVDLGGHDKAFAPQSREDSDLFNRMARLGLRFVQSWSSFCYHFSGRGSRRKDSPTDDSDEWRHTNAKNERNFIRKWGTSVRHNEYLKPIVQPKQAVSLVGLLGNERDHALPWLAHLEPYFDEILLINDSSDGSDEVARRYIQGESKASSLVGVEKLRVFDRALRCDYGAARNIAHELATFDWLFHVDLDERIPRRLLEDLQALMIEMKRRGCVVAGFPRLNTLEGAIINDVPHSQWTASHLQSVAAVQKQSRVAIRNPDIQYRLLHRRVRWINQVHEVPVPVAAGCRGAVLVYDRAWIHHPTTLQRQAE